MTGKKTNVDLIVELEDNIEINTTIRQNIINIYK